MLGKKREKIMVAGFGGLFLSRKRESRVWR